MKYTSQQLLFNLLFRRAIIQRGPFIHPWNVNRTDNVRTDNVELFIFLLQMIRFARKYMIDE